MASDINYFETTSGKALLSAHSVDEYGLWLIQGEGCLKPFISIMEGRLSAIVEYAMNKENFLCYHDEELNENHDGGLITKVEVKKIADLFYKKEAINDLLLLLKNKNNAIAVIQKDADEVLNKIKILEEQIKDF